MNRRERRTASNKPNVSRDARKADSVAELYAAGLGHMRTGRHLDAQLCCRQALAANPDHADTLHLMGLLSFHAKQHDHAVEWISRAIRQEPKTDYLTSLGNTLLEQRRHEDALKVFDKAVQLWPDDADLWRNLGNALTEMNRSSDAILSFQQALRLDPRHWDAAQKCGALLHRSGRLDEAVSHFDHLAELQAGGVPASCRHDAHNSLGAVLVDLQRFEEALGHFIKAAGIKADSVAALNNAGATLVSLRRPEEALSMFDRALTISPDLAELLGNKANALKALGRHDDALACYDRAIALKPDYVQAHSNRGSCLDEMMKADEALSSYRRALDLEPGFAEAHWNLALNRLRAGDFKTGWLENEWRWKCPALGLSERVFPQPLWLGQKSMGGVSIQGKILLLHNDQGLGDAFQFFRYVPQLAARGARVILEIQRSLREIVSRLDGVSDIICKGETIPDFDYHCPLGTLPLAFDTTLETIPADVPYLSAGDRVSVWKDRLGPTRTPRVGLVWSGNPKHVNDHNRSLALKTLLPLLDVEAQFVSLQKDVRPDDEAVLCQRSDILDLGRELDSFADTAALLAHLDLIISVDTSVAHLAGALARPVWILLPYIPDWRWLLNREDSPWYPTARLFRQTASRDYADVVDRLRTELAAWIAARRREPA
jgi:tetratricopeptide (TPR) repeat protein